MFWTIFFAFLPITLLCLISKLLSKLPTLSSISLKLLAFNVGLIASNLFARLFKISHFLSMSPDKPCLLYSRVLYEISGYNSAIADTTESFLYITKYA